MIAIELDCG